MPLVAHEMNELICFSFVSPRNTALLRFFGNE